MPGEAWGAKQRTRVEEAWHAAVLAAALTLALPMGGAGVLTSGPPAADAQPLVEKALQVMVTLRVRVRVRARLRGGHPGRNALRLLRRLGLGLGLG